MDLDSMSSEDDSDNEADVAIDVSEV
jgi:hypothetical protein